MMPDVPLCHAAAAAHPDHRSPVGGGAMGVLHRPLHPSADGETPGNVVIPRSSIAGHLLFARALPLVQNSYARISSIFAGPFAMRKGAAADRTRPALMSHPYAWAPFVLIGEGARGRAPGA